MKEVEKRNNEKKIKCCEDQTVEIKVICNGKTVLYTEKTVTFVIFCFV